MEAYEFRQRQKWSYEWKVRHAIDVARSYYDEITERRGATVHVSVGGLDSITLLVFLRKYVDPGIRAVSVSAAECSENRKIHHLLGVEEIKPYRSKLQVLQEFGFPVLSKEKAAKIKALQNPTEKNATVRNAIMTGDCGKQGMTIRFGTQSDAGTDIEDYVLRAEKVQEEIISLLMNNDCLRLDRKFTSGSSVWFELYDKSTNQSHVMSYRESELRFDVEDIEFDELDCNYTEMLTAFLGEYAIQNGFSDCYFVSMHYDPTIITGFGDEDQIIDFRVYRSGMALKFFGDLVCDYLDEPRIKRVY